MRKTSVLDFDMFIDPKDSLRLDKNHIYAPIETSLVQKTLSYGDVFFDVGAHIGYFSIIASRIVGREGLVVAFEPEARNFAILEENIKLSAISPVIAFQVAVSDVEGKGAIYLNESNSGDHRTFKSEIMRSQYPIDVVELDRLDPQITKRIDFLKIDTQGSDHLVLRGARNVIRKNPRLKILIEYFPEGMYLSGGRTNDYFDELAGFDISFVDKRKQGLTKADRTTLESLFKRERRNYTNLFARKSD